VGDREVRRVGLTWLTKVTAAGTSSWDPVHHPVSNDWVGSPTRAACMELDEVDTILFDKVAPRSSHPVWNSPSVKLVIWLSQSINMDRRTAGQSINIDHASWEASPTEVPQSQELGERMVHPLSNSRWWEYLPISGHAEVTIGTVGKSPFPR
jgi:hypothetical protein